jgi:hypothetical protein
MGGQKVCRSKASCQAVNAQVMLNHHYKQPHATEKPPVTHAAAAADLSTHVGH